MKSFAGPVCAVAVVAAGCRAAPEPPEGAAPGELTVYSGVQVDGELYAPVLRTAVDTAQAYLAAVADGTWDETNDCFRYPLLNRGDAASVAMFDYDPQVLAGVAQAEVLEGTTERYREALLSDDWTDVFKSTFDEFAITEESDRAAFAAGTSHHYYRVYDATIDVGGNKISYSSTNQFRQIDDWDGTGHPLIVLRGWLPNGATAASSAATISQLMKYEIYVPVAGHPDGETLRIGSTYSDLDIGLGEDAMFALACVSQGNGMQDMESWVVDNTAAQ